MNKTAQEYVDDRLHKLADISDVGDTIKDYIQENPKKVGTGAGVIGGGLVGGALGGLSGSLLGTGVGGGLGYGTGSLYENKKKKKNPNYIKNLLLTNLLATTIGSGATLGYAGGMERLANRNAKNNKEIVKKLRDIAEKKGMKVNQNMPYHVLSHYDPNTSAIATKNPASPKILSHEIGHGMSWGKAKNKALKTNIYRGSKALGPLAGLIPLLSTDKETAQKGAIAGYGLSLPMLAEELKASHKGSKLLKGLGKSKWGSYLGIPSYLLTAGYPAITYKVKDMLGGYKES